MVKFIINNLITIWYGIFFVYITKAFCSLSLESGLCLIYPYIKTSENNLIHIKNEIKKKWLAQVIFFGSFISVLFFLFPKIFFTTSFLFSYFKKILLIMILLKSVFLFFKKNKFTNMFISDVSAMILIIFSAVLSTLLHGIIFYWKNNEALISFLHTRQIFTLTTFLFVLCILSLALLQSSFYLINKININAKKFALLGNIVFISCIVCFMIFLKQVDYNWLNTIFNYNLLFLTIVLILQIMILFMILFNAFKVASVFNYFVIFILCFLVFSMLFPYIIPSKVELNQGLTFYNSFYSLERLFYAFIGLIFYNYISLFFKFHSKKPKIYTINR